MIRLIAVLVALMAVGCVESAAPESSTSVGRGIVVEKLFTHDGITVYRFEDYGRTRYFASRGAVQFDDVTSNGKTTNETPQEIQTVELDGVTVKAKVNGARNE